MSGSRSRWKRRILWVTGIAALLALLVLTPPLINTNRYRNRIAQTMSQSLGRPVHLDNVSMHLLPVPGFTLQNFVVSEDPAFGAEPTVRANSVEATLRLSSLWHRPLEFSRIRFIEPSVNLVRTPNGRWNLGDVLLHASRVDSAPTAQRRAGPAPRFPYVEATGGRINIKTGPEKLPFSLTDADFSLWLPSPQQWRMRLVGHPTRTDTNITDPGTVRIEGDLRRAPRADLVPVSFVGSWHDVPLGEASRIVMGEDLGWRGTLNLDASLEGRLGEAHLATKLSLGGLRRAEFFPSRTLDLQLTCLSGFALHPAMLRDLGCTLPDDAPQPLTLRAAQLTLSSLRSAPLTIQGTGIPAHWALLWAGLFSPRVHPDQQPGGTLSVDVARESASTAGSPDAPRSFQVRNLAAPQASPIPWRGTVALTLPPKTEDGTRPLEDTPPPQSLVWHLLAATPENPHTSWQLSPTPIPLGDGSTLTLASTLSGSGYSVTVSGTAAPAVLLLPARYLPQLGENLSEVLPETSADPSPVRVQFTCQRGWSGEQTCADASSASSVSHAGLNTSPAQPQ